MKNNYLVNNIIFGLVILIAIIIWSFAFLFLVRHLNLWLSLAIPLLVSFIAFYFIKRTNNFISGFIGEREIGYELKKMCNDFVIVNNGLNTGRGNIDKIAIGPTGVWTLEVKSQQGHIFPSESFLKQAYAEADYLEKFIKSKINLDLHVQSVLVFSSKYAKVRFGLTKQNGVYVIQKAWLNKLLTETHEQDLDSTTVQKISSLIA